MHLFGYFGAIIMGMALGLTGSGGSILTVPILVYLFAVAPVTATGYSLFVVGATSFIGFLQYLRQHLVHLKTAFIFSVPSMASVYLTRKWILPAIPDTLFSIGSLIVTKDIALMILFAILMIAASYSMIKKAKKCDEMPPGDKRGFNYPVVLLEGAIVGFFTGLVGAGGGFMIVPALVLFSDIPVRMAIGTSLLIITIKSMTGFLGDISVSEAIDWVFLFEFTGLSVIGILIGNYLSKFIPSDKLKPGFGWFILLMGVFIIAKELIGF